VIAACGFCCLVLCCAARRKHSEDAGRAILKEWTATPAHGDLGGGATTLELDGAQSGDGARTRGGAKGAAAGRVGRSSWHPLTEPAGASLPPRAPKDHKLVAKEQMVSTQI